MSLREIAHAAESSWVIRVNHGINSPVPPSVDSMDHPPCSLQAGQPDEYVLKAGAEGGDADHPEISCAGVLHHRLDDRCRIFRIEPELITFLYCSIDHQKTSNLFELSGRHVVEGDYERLRALDRFLEPFRCVDGSDMPLVDDCHPVAHQVCFLDIMGS